MHADEVQARQEDNLLPHEAKSANRRVICGTGAEVRSGAGDEDARLVVEYRELGVDEEELWRDAGSKGEGDRGVEAQDLVDEVRVCCLDESVGVGTKQGDDVGELRAKPRSVQSCAACEEDRRAQLG